MGVCKAGEQTCSEGAWGECIGAIEPSPRDCTSADDNDCDGKPDNTIDDSCKCVPGAKEACGEHPGNDGNGPCKAGERVCMGTGNMGVWGACNGSIGPKATDRCDVVGNDDSCDGQENGGCTCIKGEKSSCLDVYGSKGVCSAIALTCSAAGKWPSSATCAATKAEVCAADNKDEDCDGTVNDGCACANGATKVCGGCDEGTQTCVNGAWAACVAAPLNLNKGPKMLCIPGGTFSMGSNRYDYEMPIHSVTLPSFWMDESEVTYGQYTACVNDGGKCTKGNDTEFEANCAFGSVGRSSYPVNCIDQVQAAAFCKWAGKRLPIEEEWEYSAKGSNDYKYPWGNASFSDQANLETGNGPVPIMQFPGGKSPSGLWDMSGNVQEWTASETCSYVAAPGITPSCGFSSRIWRGGSYLKVSGVETGTTTYRNGDDPNNTRYAAFGFRCARNK
jgi:formylglycine-generating enzyme required for sulfatase activity